MSLHRIPAVFMRGGTSKALVFKLQDLPENRAEWDAIFLSAMGTPDPYGRQLDGMGGGLSSLNKVCVVGPPSRDDADVDFTFAQLSATDASVDYGGNCGNMSSAIGPFALEVGLIPAPAGSEAAVRIHNTNTGKIILARFPIEGGLLAADGEFALDGVAGTAAPIRIEFLTPGGAKTGKLLPTGNAVDVLQLAPPAISNGRELNAIQASLIDAANPCVFVLASDLGLTAAESPFDLEADPWFLDAMERIREAASVRMGLAPDINAARKLTSIPKVAMLALPQDAPLISSETLKASDHDIAVRMISVGQPHRAVPITGAICLAVAARVEGSIAHQLCRASNGPIRIGHPSGTTIVDAELNAAGEAEYGAVYRSARRLFEGSVVYRLP